MNGSKTLSLSAFLTQGRLDIRTDALLQRQAARESNARSYPRRIPLALWQGSGIFVRDSFGQIFIDCLAGAGALALGHHHRAPTTAIRNAMDDGVPMQTLDLTTPLKERFVDALFASLPDSFARRARIQFCGPTGADAVEAAVKLAKTATGRHGVLACSGAYHGMTHGGLSMSGNRAPKQALGGLLAGVQFIPYPYDYRCPFGLGGEAGIDAGLAHLESLLEDPESGVCMPAALIVEAVQGEGGVIPAHPRWLRGVRDITRRHGIVLVLDEVQTGLGRTGRLFAFEHAAIEPDVIALSKAIGGGLPLAVIVYDESLDTWEPGAHAGTFRGNQLAMAAGAATIEFIMEERLAARAETAGERLLRALGRLKQEFPCLGDVRGRGLMVGLEIVDTRQAKDNAGRHPASRSLALALQRQLLELGVIVELGGRHGAVIRLLPPLIIADEEIEVVVERIERALERCMDVAARPG